MPENQHIWWVMVCQDDDEEWTPHMALVVPRGQSEFKALTEVARDLTLTYHVWVGCLDHGSGTIFHQGGGCNHPAPLSPPVKEPAV